MKHFFEYNWQIREEWFEACKTIVDNKLYEERTGGVQSFAKTFYHIIKVEHDWISDLQEKPLLEKNFESFQNFSEIIQFSKELHIDVKNYLDQWTSELENKILHIDFGGKNAVHCTYGEVIRHLIAHEIHHIGQISIWAREIGMTPINANFIHRGIFIDNKK